MTTETSTARLNTAEISNAVERDFLYILGFIMSIVGVALTAYLSYVKLADKEAVCASTGSIDCAGVQSSVYSEFLGIPIAYLGFGAYITIFALFALENRIPFLVDNGKAILFSLTLFGFVYSGYLTYIEAFVLEKWCLWCVASATLMTGLFILSTTRLMRSFDAEDDGETETA